MRPQLNFGLREQFGARIGSEVQPLTRQSKKKGITINLLQPFFLDCTLQVNIV